MAIRAQHVSPTYTCEDCGETVPERDLIPITIGSAGSFLIGNSPFQEKTQHEQTHRACAESVFRRLLDAYRPSTFPEIPASVLT